MSRNGMTQTEMIKQMYKLLITGNGEKPLPEQVRNNTYNISLLVRRNDVLGKWLVRAAVIGNTIIVGIMLFLKLNK